MHKATFTILALMSIQIAFAITLRKDEAEEAKIIDLEPKNIINEEHEDHEEHEEHEDHTKKLKHDDLEQTGEESGWQIPQNTACRVPGSPGCPNPIPVPVAGACTAVEFKQPKLVDSIVLNTDCDSHAYLTAGSILSTINSEARQVSVPDEATQAAQATNGAKLSVSAEKGCTSSTGLRKFTINGNIEVNETFVKSNVQGSATATDIRDTQTTQKLSQTADVTATGIVAGSLGGMLQGQVASMSTQALCI